MDRHRRAPGGKPGQPDGLLPAAVALREAVPLASCRHHVLPADLARLLLWAAAQREVPDRQRHRAGEPVAALRLAGRADGRLRPQRAVEPCAGVSDGLGQREDPPEPAANALRAFAATLGIFLCAGTDRGHRVAPVERPSGRADGAEPGRAYRHFLPAELFARHDRSLRAGLAPGAGRRRHVAAAVRRDNAAQRPCRGRQPRSLRAAGRGHERALRDAERPGRRPSVRPPVADELDHLFGSAVRLVRLGSLFGLSSGLITSLIQIFVLGLGAYLIIADRSLTLGVLFSFTGLLSSVTSPVEQFTQLLQALQQAAGSMQRVVQILDEREEVADAPDAVPLPRLQRELRFDNVWFSYTGDRPTLQNVSLSIPAGSHVAIVGPSGAGKSSVINLILRFYDPQQGQILLDGVDLRAGTQRSLRDQMAVVFQDTFVFNTTIRENLAYGRLGATDEEIIAAARQAEIHDFILSLPAGYDTVVGERGARLSGGQRQRLAIARALLRNPAILLLDEATSALDPETEAQIQATLSQVTEQLTTIAVTHRLASAANADRIFVLNGGVLVEQGTHAELMAARGLYARLYEEQQGAALAGVATTVEASRLRRVPLFADLPPEALAAIASRLELERYAPGDTIIRQGDLGDKLYIVDRGQVEVTVNNGPMGEQRLNSLHEGDYFGEIALLLDIPRTASVTALGPVQLLSLSKADFRQLVERLPGVAQRLAPTMQGRLAQQEQLLGAES